MIIDVPDAVQWHDGMMLAPQHLQQQALRHDTALAYHLHWGSPYHWGATKLMIDRAALVSGTFRVLELEAVMPDGLIVRHSAGAGGGELTMDLKPHGDAASRSGLVIHLAVPALKTAAGITPGDLPRYRSVEGPPVADATTGEGELRIPRLAPNLVLLHTAGPNQKTPTKYVTIPIGEVELVNDAFGLTSFLAPSLTVPEESPLGRMCADLVRRIREKAAFVLERIGGASDGRSAAARDMAGEIQGLVAGLPPLEALLGSGVAHPFAVYVALTAVVGHMAAAASALPPTFSRYDHNNPYASFSELRDYLTRTLQMARNTTAAIPFVQEADKFHVTIQPGWLEKKLIVGVRPSVSMTEADVVAWMRDSLIASRSRVETLWEMRVMGAGRRAIEETQDTGLLRSRGTLLFEIDNDARFIVANEPLEIWNADLRGARRRPFDIVLYVTNGAG